MQQNKKSRVARETLLNDREVVKMGKQHTTKKEIYARFGKENVFCINTGNGEILLFEPDYYTTRIEGFAANVWILGDIVITEGYAPFGNTKLDYDKVKKIWNKAYKVYKSSCQWSYNRKVAQIRKYRRELYNLAKETQQGGREK